MRERFARTYKDDLQIFSINPKINDHRKATQRNVNAYPFAAT